ncbi:Crp/Fnr family transcriptional regulator [Mucilaginibacter celer]|uniref:Crp/Fnr family transcriptional regulator n=1 Tax=Mucilaginibacter celer TaxID=2305508 RepID=A0A494VTX6_9SPHI|nr:Crp/Fnr family transcriptional regulator [Mucilaginibacter celer]AYL97819.1 Crp/Fnr family transcriptional regulator [Mucilaginibacter celer]
MTQQLIAHIQQLLPGFTIRREQLSHFFETIAVKKDTVLLSEGATCDTIYFVNQGCLYLFYDYNDKREVIHFALENWWLTDYKTFCDSKPAVYAIAAMEDSEITCLSRANYEAMLLQFPVMALYFNKIHERAYGAALYKQKTFATTSKPDFYNYFRRTYPVLIQRIPDEIFASYIGVSPEVLRQLQAAFVS